MKQVPIDCVKRWAPGGSQSMSYPASISTTCPSCAVKAVFSTTRRQYDAHRDTLSCSADCPACNAQAHFWITNMVAHENDPDTADTLVFMVPGIEDRLDLKAMADVVPAAVLRQCLSTQEVFATGNSTATGVMVQSTLDCIFEDFLPPGNSKSNLSQLIRDSLPAIDLGKPLNTLSTSLRTDKHLDKLLKDSDCNSREKADTLVSLIECLITYLYVLPDQFRVLDEKLEALSNELGKDERPHPDEDEKAA